MSRIQKFWLSILTVTLYMLHCVRIGTRPCKYFQLNAKWFSVEKGIFSKIDLDQSIPEAWRLKQRYDDGSFLPDQWPVFVKPEWGQNALGIRCARSAEELQAIRQQIKGSRIPYLIQEQAPESREFEVFGIRHHHDPERPAVLTVTEVENSAESIPLNGILNPNSRYQEITDQFDEAQCAQLWAMSNRLGHFGICRVCYRANTIEDLLAGRVHVIEVNLYSPMPINLMDVRYSYWQVLCMSNRYVIALAWATKTRDHTQPEKPVYTLRMLYNRENTLLNYIRDRMIRT